MGYTSARRVRKFSQGSQAVAGGRRRSQAVGSPIALQPVSCDACRATYHLRCAKLTQVPRHGSWICESCTMTP